MASIAPSSNIRRLARTAAVVWAIAILVACLWPGNEIPEVDVPLADKWVHFVLFGVLAFLLRFGVPQTRWWVVALQGIAFGILVEGLQMLTNGWLHRYGDVQDVLADALGTGLGLLASLPFRQRPIPEPS